MDIDDAVGNPNGQNTPSTAAPSHVADSGDGCDDDWLGCEALHPLTWLPTPVVASAGAVLPPVRR